MHGKSSKINLLTTICFLLSLCSVIYGQKLSCVAETEKILIEAEDMNKFTADFSKADGCVRQNPNSVEALIIRSKILALKGNIDSALADANKAVDLSPRSSEAFYARGFVYHRNYRKNFGDEQIKDKLKKSAMADYDKALELNPKNGATKLDRALLITDGLGEGVLPDFDLTVEYLKASGNTAELARAYNERGYSYLFAKKWDEAINDFTAAIKLRPNYSLAYGGRALAYIYRKDAPNLDAAIADYTEIIRIRKNEASEYVNRGNIYKKKSETAKAVSDYRAALALEPNNYSAKSALEKLGVQP